MYVAGRRLRVGVRDPVAGKYVARRRGGLACAGTVAGGVRVGVHGVPRRAALGVDRACAGAEKGGGGGGGGGPAPFFLKIWL